MLGLDAPEKKLYKECLLWHGTSSVFEHFSAAKNHATHQTRFIAAFAEGQKIPLLVEEYQKVRIVAWPWADSTVAGFLPCILGVYLEML